ncbi:hypothetical protein DCO58_02835 [Helicobacter saguini]|uniref:Glycosyltransferase family 8 protein n=1 Tax=Helicobacter saguini TaxID=1548018 RepID=A0A6B0HMC9_9HELI|nr:glycosyltransferase [Helicobacter saguini]MWV62686.1 hypothetical protein [Helicobacter saguini]MWV66642.1 hypothetical protein [Helicobacter saguini]MWV68992.1 hypothetical protein [Helicobacter saguini]MWV71454.1 hypothetical protein [Helicobacter saguini]
MILTYHTLDYDTLSDYEKQEGYIFHIFTEEIKQDSKNIESKIPTPLSPPLSKGGGNHSQTNNIESNKDKNLESNLQTLQNELSKIYPCVIKVHYINDSLFENCPTLNGNYSTYYRLKIAEFLDSNIKYALYLDCDMLVLKDIRGLFSINMESKFAYVVHDYFFHSQKIIHHKIDKEKILTYDKHYFNAGFIFFNLESCRKINLWKKCENIFKNYEIEFHDQDTINYIFKGNVGILSPCFDYMSYAFGCYPIRIAKDENIENCDMYYTRRQLECGLENVVIYHYTPYKPWRHPQYPLEPSRYNYARVLEAIHLWEKFAKITPVYSDEIQNVLDSIKENEFDNYTIFIAKKLENIESNFKKDLQILAKKTRKRMKILMFGEIAIFVIIVLSFTLIL